MLKADFSLHKQHLKQWREVDRDQLHLVVLEEDVLHNLILATHRKRDESHLTMQRLAELSNRYRKLSGLVM